jgi:hypothetical protein
VSTGASPSFFKASASGLVVSQFDFRLSVEANPHKVFKRLSHDPIFLRSKIGVTEITNTLNEFVVKAERFQTGATGLFGHPPNTVHS